MLLASIDTSCPQHVHRSVRRNSNTRLIATPCSRCTLLPVNSHWRALQLTSVIKTPEHDVGLFGVVIHPGNVKGTVACGCNRGLCSIDAEC